MKKETVLEYQSYSYKYVESLEEILEIFEILEKIGTMRDFSRNTYSIIHKIYNKIKSRKKTQESGTQTTLDDFPKFSNSDEPNSPGLGGDPIVPPNGIDDRKRTPLPIIGGPAGSMCLLYDKDRTKEDIMHILGGSENILDRVLRRQQEENWIRRKWSDKKEKYTITDEGTEDLRKSPELRKIIDNDLIY